MLAHVIVKAAAGRNVITVLKPIAALVSLLLTSMRV